MSTSLRADAGGLFGALQVGGVDKLLVDSTGLDSGLSIGASVAGNALTLTLNPCSLRFRSPTLGSGTVNCRAITSQLSLTVSSGSTLGTISGQASRLVLLALDNAGTVELAIVNLAGGNQLDESNLISTTAEGGAGGADSIDVVYSQTARTSLPYRVLGFVEVTETTAGAWVSAPSGVHAIGGQVLASLNSLGYGQTWQNVSGSRSLGVTYYNTAGKPILVHVNSISSTASAAQMVIDGVTLTGTSPATSARTSISALVPPGSSYLVAITGSSSLQWAELR